MDSFIAGVFFGIFGAGYVMYGRKAQNHIAFGAGILLCIFPYFVDGFLWTMLVGVLLMAAPFVIRL